MKFSRPIQSVALLSLLCSSAFAQRHFLFDQAEPFKHEVKLPVRVIELLSHEITGVPGCDDKSPSQISPTFIGSRIDLGANRRTFIALAYENCSQSADRFWFWILLKTPRRYGILLRAGTDSVTVRSARTHRFPNIETSVSTGQGNYANLYKFNGTVYKVNRCTHTAFATGKTEPVPCRAQ